MPLSPRRQKPIHWVSDLRCFYDQLSQLLGIGSDVDHSGTHATRFVSGRRDPSGRRDNDAAIANQRDESGELVRSDRRGVEHHVDPLRHGFEHARRRVINNFVGAGRDDFVTACAAGRCDDIRADSFGELDGVAADDSAGSDYQYALARLEAGFIEQRLLCGKRDRRKRSRIRELDRGWRGDKHLRRFNCELGRRAVVGHGQEPDYGVAHGQAHARADGVNRSRDVVPRDVGSVIRSNCLDRSMTSDQSPINPEQLGAYFALVEVSGLLRHAVEQQLKEAGDVSSVQFQLLARLGDSPTGSHRMTDLADGVVYCRSGLTYRAGLLEQRGLITRAPSRDDERSVDVTITDGGRDVLARVFPGHRSLLTEPFLDPLTVGGVEALGGILGRVRDHMRSIPPRSAAPVNANPASWSVSEIARLGGRLLVDRVSGV